MVVVPAPFNTVVVVAAKGTVVVVIVAVVVVVAVTVVKPVGVVDPLNEGHMDGPAKQNDPHANEVVPTGHPKLRKQLADPHGQLLFPDHGGV